jgi:hypothetical protein
MMVRSCRLLAVVLTCAPFVTACAVSSRVPTETETRGVDLDDAELVKVDMSMGAGELNVEGGAHKLMEGEFTFGPPTMKPLVDYQVRGTTGHLRIEDPSRRGFSNAKERWDLKLNDTRPIDLQINVGAGESRLVLGSLNLRGIDIQMGVGQLTLDLAGIPTHDYDVNIRGGVGEARIHLPHDVGIVAEVKGGLGDVKTGPLVKRDGRYVSQHAESAATVVRFDIRGGIGAIHIIGDE